MAGARKRSEKKPVDGPAKETISSYGLAATAAVVLIQRLADRFGAPAAAGVVVIAAVWTFGSNATKDEFIRGVIFADKGWALPVLGVVLMFDLLFGYKIRRRWLDGESREMKRIAAEKSRLQADLLGPGLAKSMDVVTDGDATDANDRENE